MDKHDTELFTHQLRFGITVAHLERLAWRAAMDSRWRFLPFDERYEVAWSAIAEELYACDEAPSARALVQHGEKAIRHHVDDLGHTHGVYYAGHSSGRIEPGTLMPWFERYWWTHASRRPHPKTASSTM